MRDEKKKNREINKKQIVKAKKKKKIRRPTGKFYSTHLSYIYTYTRFFQYFSLLKLKISIAIYKFKQPFSCRVRNIYISTNMKETMDIER